MSIVIINIPDIQGECGVKGYEQDVLCESFTQDADLEIDVTNNQRRTFHVPKINNMSIDRKMDSASGKLLRKMLTGKVDTNDWTIFCLKAMGEDEQQMSMFMSVTLHLPILAKHELNINDGDTTERFEINCASVHYNYTTTLQDNSTTGNLPFGFDTIAGTVL